jgi:hypothetical protein
MKILQESAESLGICYRLVERKYPLDDVVCAINQFRISCALGPFTKTAPIRPAIQALCASYPNNWHVSSINAAPIFVLLPAKTNSLFP